MHNPPINLWGIFNGQIMPAPFPSVRLYPEQRYQVKEIKRPKF